VTARSRLTAYAALATFTASSALMAVFADSGWVVPVTGGIVLVAVVGELVHRSPLPAALQPLVVAAAVLGWVTWLDARPVAHGGVVPGPAAFSRLGDVARSGFTDIHRLAPPVPATRGLVLLATVGVAAIALVVHLLAVTLRRAALAGLPLLALFTTGAAVGRHGAGVLPFMIAAGGFLWLLYADSRDRVSRWGTAVGAGAAARSAATWTTDPASAPAPATLGRRIGAAAVGLGVVVPVLVPGLHGGIDRHGHGTGSPTAGNVVTINPIVSVADDLTSATNQPVLRYRSTVATPGYLRLTALDTFDGVSFSAATLTAPESSRVSRTMPPITGPGRSVVTRYAAANGFTVHWLPVPQTVTGVTVAGDWRYDANTSTVFSATATTRGLDWSTTSSSGLPSAASLQADGPPDSTGASDLSVPPPTSSRVRALARSVTGHKSSAFDKALAIQAFLTGPSFHYATHVSLPKGTAALPAFLLHTRTGFCQQFATAMAVMARLVGIPSRVAVGFTRGQRQPDGSWLVTTHDAHAWPELYFPNAGWVPFEPTPRGDGQAVRPSYTTAGATGAHHDTPRFSPSSPQPTTGPGHVPSGLRPKPGSGSSVGGAGTSAAASAGGGSSTHGVVGWVVAALLLILLAVPGVGRAVVRRRRWAQLQQPRRGVSAAWLELRDTATDLAVPWRRGATPRQVDDDLDGILAADPAARAALRRLARAEEEARYAARPTPPDGDLKDDVLLVRAALARRRAPVRRALAVVMPASTTRAIRAAAWRVADALDVIDAALAWGRRGLSRLPRPGVGSARG
jgi:transglutaminase-like putative cysteine protease